MKTQSSLMTGRTVLITGAAGDIGQAIAGCFVSQGANVILADINFGRIEQHAAAIRENGGMAHAVACDVRNEESSRAAIEEAIDQFGSLHVLINNAAAETPRGTVSDLEVTDWNEAINVNLTGPYLMSRNAIPYLAKSRDGLIINVASQHGLIPVPGRAAYAATKAALIHLTRCMAIDHAKDNIRIVCLSPGAVMTSRLVRRYGSLQQAEEILVPDYPAGRLAEPSEVGLIAASLANGLLPTITGSNLVVDGGYTAAMQVA